MSRIGLVVLLALLGRAAAAQAPEAPITQAQADALFADAGKKDGATFVPGYELSLKIGLPADKLDPYKIHFPAREFESKDGVRHSFGRAKESADYLVVVRTRTCINYLHADRAFRLVGGAWYKLKADGPMEIPPEEAAVMLHDELALWASRAPKPR